MEKRTIKKAIVITSIFPPTEAVIAFSRFSDYQLIVAGDKKSPSDWSCDNVEYLPVANQEQMKVELATVLPYNHYCRKMLGYLVAIRSGADYIIDTDDDNIPKHNWDFPSFESKFDCIAGDLGFVNIYQYYTSQKIWPRGLPLNLVNKEFDFQQSISEEDCTIGIWQGLADEDPDVDAVYRLTDDTPCYFTDKKPIVLGKGTISPFNSQNTMIRRELFPLLYLPTYVTFRFTDILRGFVAQPIMWQHGYRLGFTNATVVQKRNPHDYMKDFISEMPMYQHGEFVADLVSNSISINQSIETNLYQAYEALLKEGIVCDKELITLKSWLKDLKNI